MKPLGIVLGLLAIASAAPVFAQRSAASKVAGQYNFYGGAAGSAMRAARDYSNYYREYVQSVPAQQPIEPEIAKEAADSIGVYIAKAQKHMAYMRKAAKAANDTATLASLDTIDKHLANAAKSHQDMKDTCLKDRIEGGETLECCKPLFDHLSKAIAEHDKLMKQVPKK